MRIRYGKPIDSGRLKVNVDKSASIEAARAASLSIAPSESLVESCPVCRDVGLQHVVEIYRFTYSLCSGCGTIFVANPPAEGDLQKIYSSDYYTASTRNLYANDAVLDYRLQNVARPKVDHVLQSISPPPGSWLDIGCGTGEILKIAADRGLQVFGVETNAMQREFARERFSLEISEEFVTKKAAERLPRADVVSLFSVLEHVLDPAGLVAAIASAQRPGDHLVVEVPHYPSVSALSQTAFPDLVNRMMHPPLHLFLFSTRGLTSLLERSGYKVIDSWFFGQDAYEVLTTLALLVPQFGNSALAERLMGLANDLQEVFDRGQLSDEMLVIAKRINGSALG